MARNVDPAAHAAGSGACMGSPFPDGMVYDLVRLNGRRKGHARLACRDPADAPAPVDPHSDCRC